MMGMQYEQPVKGKQWSWRGQTEEHSIGLGSVHISQGYFINVTLLTFTPTTGSRFIPITEL